MKRGILAALLLLAACHDFDAAYQTCVNDRRCTSSGDGGGLGDAGSLDGGEMDGGFSDAGSSDAGKVDSGPGLDSGLVPPPPAADAGYWQRTFHSTFAPSEIDLANTEGSGYQWYLYSWNFPLTDAGVLHFLDGGGVQIDGGGELYGASPSGNTFGWAGIAFGGGAYFEATVSFNPQDTVTLNNGANPFFAWDTLEHPLGSQWPGQDAGYGHFVSGAFFTYDVWSFSQLYQYGCIAFEYWGIYGQTCASTGYCGVQSGPGAGTPDMVSVASAPANTDFTQPHRIGFLWIPATGAGMGLGQSYFDDVATEVSLNWTQFTGQPPPPGPSAPWTFGVIDQEHVFLTFGTGPGEPFNLYSMDVWQLSDAGNTSH